MSFLAAAALTLLAQDGEPVRLRLEADRPVLLRGVPFTLSVTVGDSRSTGWVFLEGVSRLDRARKEVPLAKVRLQRGKAVIKNAVADGPVLARFQGEKAKLERRIIPGWLCLLPALLAILLAFATREVIVSLFAGVWLGMFILIGFGPWEILKAGLAVIDTAVVGTLASKDHVLMLLFVVLLGGMIGLISYGGGAKGFADVLANASRGRRGGMISGWIMGLVLFLDDYANSLLIGNTLRPLTDRRRISREKLSYIVDSTAAPIATLGIFSTWIVFQLDLMTAEQLFPKDEAFREFLKIVPYSFYSIFTVAFVLLIAVTERDFGPMFRAEERAILTGQIQRLGARPMADREVAQVTDVEDLSPRWTNLVLPVLGMIGLSILALYLDGWNNPTREPYETDFWHVVGHADTERMILWGLLGGTALAFLMPFLRGHLRFRQAVEGWFRGCRGMFLAVVILALAWSMGRVCTDLSTGAWLVDNVEHLFSLKWLPAIAFVLCGVMSFATGSSWATMAIMIPVVAGFLSPGLDPGIFYGTLAAVLSGAVFGDHVSPISDTTIVSSIGAAADHIDHVKTQAPYALVCGGAALVCGFIPAGMGLPAGASLGAGLLLLILVLFAAGKRHAQVFEA